MYSSASAKWIFPEIILEPKEYLLIFASGKDKQYHTNFKLNSEREVVVLTDNTGNIISKISYSDMQNDISYGYVYILIGEGNGTPLQCSCLENPMGEGAW